MCTNPVKVTRKDACSNSTRTYYVPCGKCADCVKKKQAEFSALALHQGLKSCSLHFFTFTYRNETLPVALTEAPFDGDNCHIFGFERGCSDWLASDGSFKNRVLFDHCTDSAEYERCCSLKREDVKLVLKQFRKDNPDAKFKYAIFGEYGEQRGRPHYHGLFFGLTDKQAKALSDLWSKRFGFVHYAPQLSGNLDLGDYKAMSLYVSKYISKGDFSRWKHILPYVEPPRRQSSINFGSFDKEELARLASFYDGRDQFGRFGFGLGAGYANDAFLALVSSRRQSIKIAGQSFPIPDRLKEKLFYEHDDTDERLASLRAAYPGRRILKKDLVKSSPKRTQISRLVDEFARSQFDNNLVEQLRKNSEVQQQGFSYFHLSTDFIIQESLKNEKMALQSREEIAEQNLLNNLKQQKYG